MFKLDASKDGLNFMSIWYNRRLRKYETLKNAVNGAVHLAKNQLNGYKVIGIKDINKDCYVCWVYADLSGKPKVEHVYDYKQNEFFESDKNKKESINNIKEHKNDNRIDFLKKCYELHKIKKDCEKEKNITAGNSINNISNNDTKQKTFSFFEDFMSATLEKAWIDRDIKSFFKIELSLSSKGYSWFLDDNDCFIVKQTSQVIDILNKRKNINNNNI